MTPTRTVVLGVMAGMLGGVLLALLYLSGQHASPATSSAHAPTPPAQTGGRPCTCPDRATNTGSGSESGGGTGDRDNHSGSGAADKGSGHENRTGGAGGTPKESGDGAERGSSSSSGDRPAKPPPSPPRSRAPLTQQERKFYTDCVTDPRRLNFDWDHFVSPQNVFIRSDKRFDHPLLQDRERFPDPVVWEVGGNIGEDTDEYLRRYPTARLFVFEPIPSLCAKLDDKYASLRHRVKIVCAGLGDKDTHVNFTILADPNARQEGIGQWSGAGAGQGQTVAVRIISMSTALAETNLTGADITMISMNCEGCEVPLLETLLAEGITDAMPEVQLSWHPLPDIPHVIERRCRERTLLTRTHTLYYSFHFSWESWARKDLVWW